MDTIKDIFFDLDHTLWDFERNSALAFSRVFSERKIDVNLDRFLEHYIPLNLAYWERYRNEEISQETLRYGRLKDTFNALSISVGEESIIAISNDYIRLLPENNFLFDGTIEVLDYLSTKYRLHIITNGFQDVQYRKLTNSRIHHYFATITNSEMAGVKKPNPLIFEYALKQAGAGKETSVMIGDCIDADVRGALHCGISAILFSKNPCDPAIKRISCLTELKQIL